MEANQLPPAAAWLPAGTFDGQVALVTGGGTGLGLQISRGLAALGATTVILSRSEEHHRPFLEEGAQRGWKVAARVLDVRDADGVHRMADELREEFGAPHILVNNAAGNFVCPAERLSSRAWRAVLGIVLDGTFYCSRSFGRGMIREGRGVMLNIVATYAWTGMPGVVHSASAKAGVLAMSRTLAAEWARHGVRVNAIAPGVFQSEGAAQRLWPDEETETRMREKVPARRFGTADEMAAQCLWLLSPASEYVTGECLVVDGGASLGQGMWEPGTAIRRDKSAGNAD